jgi:hypothetical protein
MELLRQEISSSLCLSRECSDFAADTINAKTSLAMQVLAEVPEQVTSYMFHNQKAPPPAY